MTSRGSDDDRENDQLRAARQRLEILDALVVGLDRRDELLRIVSDSLDFDLARATVMEAFDVSESGATAVLETQMRRFTIDQRERMTDERDQMRARVAELSAGE